jgi:hypothetical protein
MKGSALRLFRLILCLLTFSLLASACGLVEILDTEALEGQWTIVDSQGLSVPHSFFWAMMDYVEFRSDGTLWGLMHWPPGSQGDLRLNATAAFAVVETGRIEIVGSCRYKDPCSVTFDAVLRRGELQLSAPESSMTLERSGPQSGAPPSRVPGPAPSATPVTLAPVPTRDYLTVLA